MDISSIANQIKIEAIPSHESEHDINGANHVFSYSIVITNNSSAKVKLTYRKWLITDGLSEVREVEGAGVVGLQPEIAPNSSFQYQSWCPLFEEFGQMTGSYTFINLETQEEFEVDIPEFILQPNYSLN